MKRLKHSISKDRNTCNLASWLCSSFTCISLLPHLLCLSSLNITILPITNPSLFGHKSTYLLCTMQHLSSTFASGRHIYIYSHSHNTYGKRSILLFFLHIYPYSCTYFLFIMFNVLLVQQCRRGATNGFDFQSSILNKRRRSMGKREKGKVQILFK